MAWKRDLIIFKQQGIYACFPRVQLLNTGQLAVGFTKRAWPTHYDPGTWCVVLSSDSGETWQETSDTSLMLNWRGTAKGLRHILPDGTYLEVTGGGHIPCPATERAEWEAKGYHTADHETDPTLCYVTMKDMTVSASLDGGRTWHDRTVPAPPDIVMFFSFGGVILQDGTILCGGGSTVYTPGMDLRHLRGQPFRNYVARSTDGGQTWEFVRLLDDPNGDATEEIAFLEVAAGHVLALTRVERRTHRGYLWQQWSDDGGKTWSEPVETRIWGYPPHLLRLSDGRLLCSYGYRRQPGAGVRAVVSEDGGRSWALHREYILRDDGGAPAQGWSAEVLARFVTRGLAGSDLGYPRSVQLADGSIFTVYYITTPDRITHIAATHWRLEGDL